MTSPMMVTERPGTLANDFFVILLDMGTKWQPAPDGRFPACETMTENLRRCANAMKKRSSRLGVRMRHPVCLQPLIDETHDFVEFRELLSLVLGNHLYQSVNPLNLG